MSELHRHQGARSHVHRDENPTHAHPGLGPAYAIHENPPAVLLRDTPEDRERLAQAIRRAEYPDTEHGANYRDDRKADAIIAALRGQA